MDKRIFLGLVAALSLEVSAQAETKEYLIHLRSGDPVYREDFLNRNGGRLEVVSEEGLLYKWTSDHDMELTWDANIDYVQPNYEYRIFFSPSLEENRAALLDAARREIPGFPGGGENGGGGIPGIGEFPGGGGHGGGGIPGIGEFPGGGGGGGNPGGGIGSIFGGPELPDNPAIQAPVIQAAGADPLLEKAWGMMTIGANKAWKKTNQGKDVVVAVTDTGVDYNHPDLINNMWRNKGEIPNNQIDDEKNGFVDDVVGWDFASNDDKPYDHTLSMMQVLLTGGNPGHGTHVSGVIGARLENGQGTVGVAPQVKIMAVRFVDEKGKAKTEAAVKAVDYAVQNGANIINASWGGEAGDEPDQALREAIQRAEKKGVIFVAAAGNGRLNKATMKPEGFSNDDDKKPIVPASYSYSNIVSVAATDNKDSLAPFSNWGKKTTKIAAPGVKILSTVPGNRYQDTILELGSVKATWDGTSMAAPFVSGALAVVWSQNRAQKADEVIGTLLKQITSVSGLESKVSTGGRLDLKNLGN